MFHSGGTMLDVRCLLSVLCLLGHGIGPCAADTNGAIRTLGGGLFQIGSVMLDQSNRFIRFPAAVQLRVETVEYAVVHQGGKTHESIFRTAARPQDIQVALLLLGARPQMTNSFGAQGDGPPLGDKVWIEAHWTNAGSVVKMPLEELVRNKETRQSMSHGEWIYNGSNFSEGAFTAQRDGSIISIQSDPDALINNPRPGRENDDLHQPNTERLPAMGAPVEITIRLKQP
jgi:hypothetical protein